MDKLFITMCVIAYNEENSINNILSCIKEQDYDHKSMEIVLVDGMSSDKTRDIMVDFAKNNENEFDRVVVLDNPKRTLPSGWNVALREYKGDAIIKVDAHAVIPQDFVSKNVAVLNTGEYICGGQRPNIIDEPTPFKETLLLAEIQEKHMLNPYSMRHTEEKCLKRLAFLMKSLLEQRIMRFIIV